MSAELEKGLFSLLSGNSPQTTAASRIYPRLPQGVTFPAIMYTRLSTNRNHAIDGTVGVTEALIAVDCIAESYSEAKTLADEVRSILHGYRGAWSTLSCRLTSLTNESEDSEQDGDRVTHWVTQTYRIWTNMD
jgi:hypothetical protein